MKTDDFDYELPKQLIAQTPLKVRTNSKMLVLDKETGEYVNLKITRKQYERFIKFKNAQNSRQTRQIVF